MCYNFPRACLKGRYDNLSLSLSLSVSRARTSPITLSSQLVSNNAFIHSDAPSVGYQTDQFSSARPRMQRNISLIAYYSKADPPFSSPVLNYSPTCKYSFSSNPAMFYRVLYDGLRSLLQSRQLNALFVRNFPSAFAFSRVGTRSYSNAKF